MLLQKPFLRKKKLSNTCIIIFIPDLQYLPENTHSFAFFLNFAAPVKTTGFFIMDENNIPNTNADAQESANASPAEATTATTNAPVAEDSSASNPQPVI